MKMMMLLHPTKLHLLLLLFLQIPIQTKASLVAYVYYEDATCSSSSMISGTFVYAYNDSKMTGKGVVRENYYGPCKFFKGGFHDFMYSKTTRNGNFMKNGYCVTCSGIVGCSSIKNSCEGFQTTIPSKAYTSTAKSTTSSNSTSNSTSNSEDAISDELLEEAEFMKYSVYKEISMDIEDESILLYSFLGMLCGFLSMFILFSSMKVIKLLRRSKTSVDSSKFLDDIEKSEQESNGNVEATNTGASVEARTAN